MHRPALIPLCALSLSLLAGCGVFRGIPTHGGGKRFDEEQRIVAGTIRQSLADMDLRELTGRKVLISVECISQDGGGSVSFPGLTNLSGGVSGNVGSGNLVQINQNQPVGGTITNDNANTNFGANAGFGYSTQTSYSATAMSTMPDLGYLKAALEMKARHAGIKLVPSEPDVVLYVLVDVLGTNRSHLEHLVTNTEVLEASCECTYYAMDPRTGELVFEARQASSAAVYQETHRLLADGAIINRSLSRTTPTSLPVEEKIKPSTQPTVVRAKKPWWDLTHFAGAGD